MPSEPQPLDDILANPSECNCEFTEDALDEGDSFSYLRRCSACQRTAWSLHCPHDGIQSTCVCGARLPQIETL